MYSGFSGEPSTLGVFTAIKSGSFNASSTWENGIIPYGNCTIFISENVTVTLERPKFELKIRMWHIYGSLSLGSSEDQSFRFVYSQNIIVYSGARLIDNTKDNMITIPTATIVKLYPGGLFEGDNTAISVSSAKRSISEKSTSASLGSSVKGPYTVATQTNGDVVTYNKVAFIPAKSGEFSNPGTWIGEAAPTPEVCKLASGCLLNIPSEITLSTESLNGVMNVNFDVATVSVNATLQLGTSGTKASVGFRFLFVLQLNCYGTLQDVTGGTGGILMPRGSSFNLFNGAIFLSLVPTFLLIFDPDTGAIIGVGLVLSVNVVGPFFVTSSATSGAISVSTTGMIDFFPSNLKNSHHIIGSYFRTRR